jgi:hypothetical protein
VDESTCERHVTRMPHAPDMSAGGETRTLASFCGAHAGGRIIVCACGESLNTLTKPRRFVTIGVNDVNRKFDPDYPFAISTSCAAKSMQVRSGCMRCGDQLHS